MIKTVRKLYSLLMILTLLNTVQGGKGKGKERKGEELFIFPSDLISVTEQLPRVMIVSQKLRHLVR